MSTRPQISRRTLLATGSSLLLATLAAPGAAFAASPFKDMLRLALGGSSVDSLDPHRTQGQVIDIVRYTNLFDGLAEYRPDGTVALVLAESMTPNEDASEWTVRLRPDARWHDGRPVSSSDVLWTIRRIQNPQTAAKGAALLRFIDADRIEIVDALTLIIRLPKPYGPFRDIWANRYLRFVPEGFDPAAPIGSGPYKLVSFTPGRESLYERFDDYFREPAKVRHVMISDIAEASAQMNALRGGQIDLAYDIPVAEARVLSSNSQLALLENPSSTAIQFFMRTDKAPFDDPRVRRAFRLIADREQMVRIAMGGFGQVANDIQGRTVTPCGTRDPALRQQDIAEAKRLLDEAGKPNLTVTLTAVSGIAGMVEGAQVFAEQAKKAGVTVNVSKLDTSSFLAGYGEWDFGVDFLTDAYLPVVARSLLPGGTANSSHWKDDEFIALYERAVAIPDALERCTVIDEMRRIEHERGPTILWGFANALNAYNVRVRGLEPYAADSAFFHLRKLSFG